MASQSVIDSRLLLILGFGVLSSGIIIAYATPATGYELSVYSGTPTAFWASSVVALAISVRITFFWDHKIFRQLAILLGGLSMTAIVSLPIIRGYHYAGEGDALTHLGRTRDLNSGILSMTDLKYPAVHTLGSITSDIAGIKLTHSLLLFIIVFVISFFVFVPLAVRELTYESRITHIGVFSGFLLLPINHVGSHMDIHPTSQAVMFAPALLYLFLLNFRRLGWRSAILFFVVGSMFVFLHPQQAANYVLFFGIIAVIQIIHSVLQDRAIRSRKRPIYALVGVFSFSFWLWAQNLAVFESSIAYVLLLPFKDTEAAASTARRGVSLGQLGGGLEELFLKLFFVAFVFCFFASFLMVTVGLNALGVNKGRVYQRLLLSESPTQRVLFLYFTCGFVVVTGLFFVYLLGGITDQYFRHYAFMMGIITVLGAVALGRVINGLELYRSKRLASQAIMVVFIIFLLLSLPVVFSSPYFYQSSNHVTKSQMAGYETAFEYQSDSYSFDHVRSPAGRYGTAINGVEYQARRDYYRDGVRRGGIPDHFADQQLRSHYDEPVHVAITGSDRIRDPVLYQGFRFNHDDFSYLDTEPGIDKVYSNPEFDLYLVNPD